MNYLGQNYSKHSIFTFGSLRFLIILTNFFFYLYFLRKFVKDQKQVQEDISRMSSKAISKVQDDIKNMKQLLSASASGLQRQGLAIDKLKLETAQVKTVFVCG